MKQKIDERKLAHIDLALNAPNLGVVDSRFYYEPIFGKHPRKDEIENYYEQNFLGKKIRVPFWVSSMTGGTNKARSINQNFAHACRHFKVPFALGSCRPILNALANCKTWEEKNHFLVHDPLMEQFDLREALGEEALFFANFGIIQVDECLQNKELLENFKLILDKLGVDGFFVHLNPTQEWLQPEGDYLARSPLEILRDLFKLDWMREYKVGVKEVGQGFGPESMLALIKLPLDLIEFAGYGGTNFSHIEIARSKIRDEEKKDLFPLVMQGHSADEMLDFLGELLDEKQDIHCKHFILSGGVKNFLDGHYLLQKFQKIQGKKNKTLKCVYGQALAMLEMAVISEEALKNFMFKQLEGLVYAENFLKLR